MPTETREVRPFSKPGHVLAADTRVLAIPAGWALLPPGDAALSKRIKQDGPTWTVVEMKGNKRFSRGIWAPATRIAALQAERAAELQDPAYQRQLAAGRNRRAAEQVVYAEDFRAAVQAFLNFHHTFRGEAQLMAKLISDHAVPVGSGTVARTERIPLEQRAESAVIAWMRHQTTAYDSMKVARVKGARRDVRRQLAEVSRVVLDLHRGRAPHPPEPCVLCVAATR